MQWLAAICVRRPVFTWVLMLSLVVIGISSVRGLGVDRFPNIDFPVVTVTTVLLTMYDSRTRLADQVADEVRRHFGPIVLSPMIPRNVRISEAPSYGKPVLVYDLKCVGSEAYLRLATEVIQRERELKAS